MSTTATPAWEQCKENAAPLQRGRNVAELERSHVARGLSARPLSSKEDNPEADPKEEQKQLEKMIQHYESLVRPSEAPHITQVDKDDDPLVHWLSYIKFYQDSFPSDTHHPFLLMERCTRALVKMPHYSNDPRFIGVCAKYADKTKDPMQVFKYLHTQKVGQTTALFWIAWAFVAEKDGDFPFAEKIFKKGISKSAQPLDQLKQRHRQFQRRMSRHWLNNSQQQQQNDDDDDEEGDSSSRNRRAALGGLSRDRLRRNDRATSSSGTSSSSHRLVASARASRNMHNILVSSNTAASAFPIFVEGENQDPGFNLDHSSYVPNENRRLEREADRLKENTLTAEPWNERGGLHTTSNNPAIRSRRSAGADRGAASTPAPAFAVFVDEECAAKHRQDEEEQQANVERHRRVRDERTFRDRTEEDTAERLARDPLRYVRDPAQMDSDRAAEEEAAAAVSVPPPTQSQEDDSARTQSKNQTRPKKKAPAGFQKSLLKAKEDGREQCFEEARATRQAYRLVTPAQNFNLLHNPKTNNKDDSNMVMGDDSGSDIDEDSASSVEEVSMGQNEAGVAQSPETFVDKDDEDLHAHKARKLNSTSKKGRVLFRSEPSFEDSSAANHHHHAAENSAASSVLNESDAVGLPTAKEEETINTKLAMKELSMMFSSPAFGVDDDGRRGEPSRRTRDGDNHDDDSYDNIGDLVGNFALNNSIIGGPNEDLRGNKTPGGLQRIQSADSDDEESSDDENVLERRNSRPEQASGIGGFQIYQDDTEPKQHGESSKAHSSFQIFQDESFDGRRGLPDEQPKFEIYQDDTEAQAFPNVSAVVEQGETAPFGALNEPVKPFNDSDSDSSQEIEAKESTYGFNIYNDDGGASNNGDETADINVMDELFQDMREEKKSSQKAKSGTGGFEIFVDSDASHDALISPKELRNENAVKETLEYEEVHNKDIFVSLKRLRASSTVIRNSNQSLLSLLSGKGLVYNLPQHVLPRFGGIVKGRKEIRLGKHSGTISKELGRGAFGAVFLMESPKTSDIIAVKAQSPIDCLALEFQILQSLETRVKCGGIRSNSYPFPRPFSFIALADGAMMSMTAGSESGLNLVDLANLYRVKLGESLPEVLVLHYTSRMLKHVKTLRECDILHLDIKPDNWVMVNSKEDGRGCHDDLMLVDFGRAVDLQCHKAPNIKAINFVGNACSKDMRSLSMRAGKAWSFDVDAYGILCSIHILLFGCHLKASSIKDNGKGEHELCLKFRRYWQHDIWREVFDVLLIREEDDAADVMILERLRERIDDYLKGVEPSLATALSRQERFLPSSRSQL